MQSNQLKASLIQELSGAQSTPATQNLLKLIDILITETRIDNDTAPIETICRNQGKIDAYITLSAYITNGLPGANRAR